MVRNKLPPSFQELENVGKAMSQTNDRVVWDTKAIISDKLKRLADSL